MDSPNNQPASQPQNAELALELQLEAARKENLEAQKQLLDLNRQEQAAQHERVLLLADQSWRDALQTGPAFYDAGIIKTLASNEFGLRSDDKGTVTGLVGSKRVPLGDVLNAIATKYPSLVKDKRTLPRSSEPANTVRSKSDLTTIQQKTAYIEQNGLAAYEALPLRSVVTREIKTFADFSRLPIPVKTKLVAEHGLEWVERLSRK